MYRYIYAKANALQVNTVAKYLNKNLDGAYKLKVYPNRCEIYMRMYYQEPGQPDSFQEMKFIIDVTTYANKIRVNITENNEMEKTIGQLVINPDNFEGMPAVRKAVMDLINKSISKEFSQFDYIY